jgi:hypothetical protein
MPYYDAQLTTRYAVIEGAAIPSLEDFLDIAEAARIVEADLNDISVPSDGALDEGPPCLQVLTRNGVPEGGRNEVMFNLGVYARMKFEDDWEPELDNLNNMYMHPPLPRGEINAIVKQLNKKEYFYKCRQVPLCNHCNKDMCRHRKYGIGGGNTDDPGVMLDSITKILTEPPIWMVEVNGHRMQMDTEELCSQAKFKRRCVDALTTLPSTINGRVWDRLVNKLLQSAEFIDAPEDASPRGQLSYLLEQFCTTKAQARIRDELLMGKPWTDGGTTYFRSNDFFKYLEQQKFRCYATQQAYAVLSDMYVMTQRQFKIKGKCVRCWAVPEFVQQAEAHEAVRVPENAF